MLSSKTIENLIESDPALATFKADTSVAGSPSAIYLEQLGAAGIPLIVIDGPGVSEPIQASFYTANSLIEMIDQARGG